MRQRLGHGLETALDVMLPMLDAALGRQALNSEAEIAQEMVAQSADPGGVAHIADNKNFDAHSRVSRAGATREERKARPVGASHKGDLVPQQHLDLDPSKPSSHVQKGSAQAALAPNADLPADLPDLSYAPTKKQTAKSGDSVAPISKKGQPKSDILPFPQMKAAPPASALLSRASSAFWERLSIRLRARASDARDDHVVGLAPSRGLAGTSPMQMRRETAWQLPAWMRAQQISATNSENPTRAVRGSKTRAEAKTDFDFLNSIDAQSRPILAPKSDAREALVAMSELLDQHLPIEPSERLAFEATKRAQEAPFVEDDFTFQTKLRAALHEILEEDFLRHGIKEREMW